MFCTVLVESGLLLVPSKIEGLVNTPQGRHHETLRSHQQAHGCRRWGCQAEEGARGDGRAASREGSAGQGDASVNIALALKSLPPAAGLHAAASLLQELRDTKLKLNDKTSGYVIDILQAIHVITNLDVNKDWIDNNGWYVEQDASGVQIAAE